MCKPLNDQASSYLKELTVPYFPTRSVHSYEEVLVSCPESLQK